MLFVIVTWSRWSAGNCQARLNLLLCSCQLNFGPGNIMGHSYDQIQAYNRDSWQIIIFIFYFYLNAYPSKISPSEEKRNVLQYSESRRQLPIFAFMKQSRNDGSTTKLSFCHAFTNWEAVDFSEQIQSHCFPCSVAIVVNWKLPKSSSHQNVISLSIYTFVAKHHFWGV